MPMSAAPARECRTADPAPSAPTSTSNGTASPFMKWTWRPSQSMPSTAWLKRIFTRPVASAASSRVLFRSSRCVDQITSSALAP